MDTKDEWPGSLASLRIRMAWEVMRGISMGRPLNEAMQSNFDLVNAWSKDVAKENKARKRSTP